MSQKAHFTSCSAKKFITTGLNFVNNIIKILKCVQMRWILLTLPGFQMSFNQMSFILYKLDLSHLAQQWCNRKIIRVTT